MVSLEAEAAEPSGTSAGIGRPDSAGLPQEGEFGEGAKSEGIVFPPHWICLFISGLDLPPLPLLGLSQACSTILLISLRRAS